MTTDWNDVMVESPNYKLYKATLRNRLKKYGQEHIFDGLWTYAKENNYTSVGKSNQYIFGWDIIRPMRINGLGSIKMLDMSDGESSVTEVPSLMNSECNERCMGYINGLSDSTFL